MMSKKQSLSTILLMLLDEFNSTINNSTKACMNSSSNANVLMYDLIKNLLHREVHYRVPGFYEHWIHRYTEEDFFSHFRMYEQTMEHLVTEVGPKYVQYFSSNQHGGLPPLECKKSVMMTIWYLAKGDTLISTSDRFNVSVGTCHRLVHRIINCIVELIPKYITWPTKEECNTIIEEFYKFSKYPNVIGAIDGCHVICKIPLEQHDSYQDRKFNHSITLQGICTASRIFTDISVGWPGSIHDARILKESSLGINIERNGSLHYFYDEEKHLVGDSAYPLRLWLMAPYRDTGRLTAMQKKHNTNLSKTRVVIENVFGLLKGRWRILKYINVNTVERAVNIISACCLLHNFCLINKDDFDQYEEIEPDCLNYSVSPGDTIQAEAVKKRNDISLLFN